MRNAERKKPQRILSKKVKNWLLQLNQINQPALLSRGKTCTHHPPSPWPCLRCPQGPQECRPSQKHQQKKHNQPQQTLSLQQYQQQHQQRQHQ
jgi:hypothetical protein